MLLIIKAFLKDNQNKPSRTAEYLPGNKDSCWGFKRALREDRPNAVNRYGPDTAKTVNAAFA